MTWSVVPTCKERLTLGADFRVMNLPKSQALKCVPETKHRVQSTAEKPTQIYQACTSRISLEVLIQLTSYIVSKKTIERIRKEKPSFHIRILQVLPILQFRLIFKVPQKTKMLFCGILNKTILIEY
ncbi:hypothetical protein Trydic_g13704 [Trypoxylus dichotomus]